MTETLSITRKRGGTLSGLMQQQFFAKNCAVEELDFVVHAREAKTLRLREARMAKDLKARTMAMSALINMRAKKA